jgi:hypothetical protein
MNMNFFLDPGKPFVFHSLDTIVNIRVHLWLDLFLAKSTGYEQIETHHPHRSCALRGLMWGRRGR